METYFQSKERGRIPLPPPRRNGERIQAALFCLWAILSVGSLFYRSSADPVVLLNLGLTFHCATICSLVFKAQAVDRSISRDRMRRQSDERIQVEARLATIDRKLNLLLLDKVGYGRPD